MRLSMRRKKRTGVGEAPSEKNMRDDEAPVFKPQRAGGADTTGVFDPPKSASSTVPRYSPVKRDFFELEPEEVETWKASRGALATRRKRDLRPALSVAAAACALGLVVTAIVLFWPSSTVKVPKVAGKTLSEAMGAARGSNLDPLVGGFEYSDRYPDGVVLSQEPEAGRVIPKGSKLKLVVSKGPRQWTEAPGSDSGLSSLTSTAPESGATPAGPLSAATICIDPGGQAKPGAGAGEWTDPGLTSREFQDVGAQGVSTGNPEHLLNMDIATRLKGLLEKDGVKVVMTRDSGDVDLSNAARAEIASQAGADLLVSIHLGNSTTDPGESGSACLYPARNRWAEAFYLDSKAAALFVEAAVVRACGTEERGVEPRDDKAMFNWSKVPVIEVQVAFLSNPAEDVELASEEFRQKAAWGLRDGIVKYLRNP